MTVSFVGAASAEATSLTLPAHQAGDLIIIVAWSNSLSVAVTPAGWAIAYTASSSAGANRAIVVAYKNATSAGDVSGTWTNAAMLSCVVYRDDTTLLTAGGLNATVGINSATLAYPALNAYTQGNNFNKLRAAASYILRIAACTSNSSDIDTAPAGYTNRLAFAGASINEIVVHESNTTLASQTATNQTINQTVVASAVMLELFDTGAARSAGGGMLVHPGMSGGMRG